VSNTVHISCILYRMDHDHLEFDGKKYISSGRAAGLVGYTKDYVGQLARAGKLEARLIGRNWYVSEDSIRKHKLAVHYTLTKSKKSRPDEVYTENTIYRKDISERDDPDTFARTSQLHSIPPLTQRGAGRAGDFARRELVRADVRYEAGESLEYAEGSYVPKLRDTPAGDLPEAPSTYGVASIPLAVSVPRADSIPRANPEDAGVSVAIRSRKPPTERSTERPTAPSRLSRVHAVDGVAVVTRREQPVTRSRIDRRGPHPRVSRAEVRDVRSAPTMQQRHTVVRPSKRIPVLVSLIAFAVFCVWYWFVR